MKNLIFRVDSGLNIGSGHLMRCLTLANNIKKESKIICTFITRDNVGNFSEIITQNGFRLIILEDYSGDQNLENYSEWLGTSQEKDATQTHKALKNNGLEVVDILVVDHYALDIKWEKEFRNISNKIVVIDDLANRQHCCDILLDQNIAPNFSTRYDNLTPKKCKKFLGISYCLLRDDFFEIKKSIKIRSKLNNVLIFFGGVDKDNATMTLLRLLEPELDQFKHVYVVAGKSNPYKQLIEEFCIKQNNCHYLEQVTNMAELIAKSDISIGAGGATTGERIYLGLPSIVFTIADNQVEVANYLYKNNYITYLGDQYGITNSRVIEELNKYIKSPNLLKKQSAILLDVSESKLSKLIQEIVSS